MTHYQEVRNYRSFVQRYSFAPCMSDDEFASKVNPHIFANCFNFSFPILSQYIKAHTVLF